MPALVNCSKGANSMGSFCTNPMDLGPMFASNSNMDICGHPCKRARSFAPFPFGFCEFEQAKQPTVAVLPDECLYEIFRRIPGEKERSSCACVSKHWLMLLSSIQRNEILEKRSMDVCKVVRDPVCDDMEMVSSELDSDGYLTRSVEGKKATDVRLAAIAVGTGGRGGLGKLLIHGSNSIRGVTDLGLTAVARGCPSLQVLSLWNTPRVGDEGLCEIAKECHLLERLDLCNCPSISNKGLIAIAQSCPNLTALSIESCSKITNEGLHAVGKFCTKLQSISIKDCPLVGDHGVSSLLSSASSVLTKVKLQNLSITDFSLAVIGHYGKLVTSLVLSGLQNVSEKGFWVMGNAQGLLNLMALTVSSCRGITDSSLVALAKGCVNLKHAYLRKCSFISDVGLVAFAKAAVSLESLQLEECNRFTQSGLVGAITNCGMKLKGLSLVKCMGIKETAFEDMVTPSSNSSLKSLTIRSCPGFGSSSLAKVGKLCPQLQDLDLNNLCSISDGGLLPLLENSEAGLVKVNLSGCLNLTDKVISALTRLHGGSLESLNLDGCTRISDTSLASIAENCLFLRDLDVSKCSVTDFGITVLSSSVLLNLQVLSVSGCVQLSNECLPCLMQLGKTLMGLNLQNCCLISSGGVELLLERLWRCDILY